MTDEVAQSKGHTEDQTPQTPVLSAPLAGVLRYSAEKFFRLSPHRREYISPSRKGLVAGTHIYLESFRSSRTSSKYRFGYWTAGSSFSMNRGARGPSHRIELVGGIGIGACSTRLS